MKPLHQRMLDSQKQNSNLLQQLYQMLQKLPTACLLGEKSAPPAVPHNFQRATRQPLRTFSDHHRKLLSNLSRNSNTKTVFLK